MLPLSLWVASYHRRGRLDLGHLQQSAWATPPFGKLRSMTLSHCDQEPPIPHIPHLTIPSDHVCGVPPSGALRGRALIPQPQTWHEELPSHQSAKHLVQWATRQGLSRVTRSVGNRAQAIARFSRNVGWSLSLPLLVWLPGQRRAGPGRAGSGWAGLGRAGRPCSTPSGIFPSGPGSGRRGKAEELVFQLRPCTFRQVPS